MLYTITTIVRERRTYTVEAPSLTTAEDQVVEDCHEGLDTADGIEVEDVRLHASRELTQAEVCPERGTELETR